MAMREIVAGLNILMKYDPEGGTCAEHDVLYAAPNVGKNKVSEEDAEKLKALGWHWSNQGDSWTIVT